MKIIYGRAQSGKTTELIRRSSITGCVIVVADGNLKRHVMYMAHQMKHVIPTPITYYELINHRGIKSPGFLIDDADLLLQYICRNKLEAISMTNFDELLTDDLDRMQQSMIMLGE